MARITDAELAPLTENTRSWLRDVLNAYSFDLDEDVLLLETARTMDRLELLHQAIADGPAMVKGSRNQPVPNPLGAEIRAESALLARHLRNLALPRAGELSGRRRHPSMARKGRR